ncbi:hypothetical protein PBCVCVB1_432L [Paramecium bursaria Chlorella virus CVB-1]|nr:hypothetical protein PBCVCVB1_432L [Paramecium bursaria Chlorella virus CVB-1]
MVIFYINILILLKKIQQRSVICPRRMSFVPGKCHLTPVLQEGIKDISCSGIFTNQKAPNNQSPQQPKQPTTNMAHRSFPVNVRLSEIRHLIDLVIEKVSYTQYMRSMIPCGYTSGDNMFVRTFDTHLPANDVAFLKKMFALHREYYEYESKMVAELAMLRQLYTDISSSIEASRCVMIAKENGTLDQEDKPDFCIQKFDSYDEADAFGEEFDWIA